MSVHIYHRILKYTTNIGELRYTQVLNLIINTKLNTSRVMNLT